MIIIVATTLGLFVIITLLSRRVKTIKKEINTKLFYTISFILLLLTCGLLSKVGINIMYSAFLVGYTIKSIFNDKKYKEKINSLENLVFSFFVPIYFALVGIQLNIVHDISIINFITFFTFAFGLEFFGTWIMLLFTKYDNSVKMNYAITMNARGGPGIVLATVAYASKIINLEFFTILILTTMISSMIAGYYLRYQQKKNQKIFDNI